MVFLVQESDGLSLTEMGRHTRREVAALSRAAGRIFEKAKMDTGLCDRLGKIKLPIQQI